MKEIESNREYWETVGVGLDMWVWVQDRVLENGIPKEGGVDRDGGQGRQSMGEERLTQQCGHKSRNTGASGEGPDLFQDLKDQHGWPSVKE